jgi:two-component system LytT family response regulator
LHLKASGSEALVHNTEKHQYILSALPAVVPMGGPDDLRRESIAHERDRYANTERSDESSNLRTVLAAQTARLIEILPDLESLVTKSFKIAVKSKGDILFVDPSRIACVEAQGNQVLLQGPSESHLLRESISAVAHKLKPCGFIRIHRSMLVNTSFVEGIRSRANRLGEHVLYIKGGRELTISRTYKRNVKSIAKCWVGTNVALTER